MYQILTSKTADNRGPTVHHISPPSNSPLILYLSLSLSLSLSIVFSSKAYDNINVSSIFRDTKISSYLPDGIKDNLPLKIFYSYDPPLSGKIFNYSSFLKVLDIDSLKEIVHKDCSCKTSPFCYSPHNHILTGDLSIITNPRLRALMQYGTKYREAFYQSSDNIITSFNTSVDNFVKNTV